MFLAVYGTKVIVPSQALPRLLHIQPLHRQNLYLSLLCLILRCLAVDRRYLVVVVILCVCPISV